ncbi:MAG: DUF5915 domain-containing protein, partial [Candidatus Thermoplasmatota archaeon]|nr:DUF5915 domain-containing protein [Candidatus Thermoplasmatota archaeon]
TRRIQAKRKDMDLAIEDTIKLHVWMNNAPALFQNDIDWIVQETRASEHTFEESEGRGDSFEVDGSTIWYSVQ